MIDAAIAWATYPVPTPAGLLLLLLVFHTAPVKRAALATASTAGISTGAESEEGTDDRRRPR